MPIEFMIYPRRNLNVLLHYGYCDTDQALACLERYHRHPDYRPNHLQLVDCSGVSGFRRNATTFLKAQISLTDFFPPVSPDRLVCFYDTGGPGRELSDRIRRPWEMIPYMVNRVAHTEHHALRILGQPEKCFADFHAAAARPGVENLFQVR